MMMRRVASACGLMAMAAVGARAQTVEFRFVERQGQQAIVTPLFGTATTDAVLSFAVQARVVGGAANRGLGNFNFNIAIVGEPEANGALARMIICNADGTYALNPTQAVSSTLGRGGLAAAYIYLAGIGGGSFNGLINSSSGTYTNRPDQDIGLVTGAPIGGAMLRFTDVDASGDPDTYTGPVPSGQGATAALDVGLANTYFAANGNWIDVYRFRYVVSNIATPRVLHVALNGMTAQTFSSWGKSSDAWGPEGISEAPVSAATLDIPIGGMGACCDTATGACAMVNGAGCAGGTFAASGMCAPSPCPVMGSCCVSGGACSIGAPSACVGGQWTLGRGCVPNSCQQPVLCCDATGACAIVVMCATGVATLGSSCTPNPCPQPGACCDGLGGCAVVTRPNCEGQLWVGGSCSPIPCPTGACCLTTRVCVLTEMGACNGTWFGGACAAVVCPVYGRCCTLMGACMFTTQAGCVNTWSIGGACGVNACPILGACCQRNTCGLMQSAACEQVHGQYRGDGVACLPVGTFNACCTGNFDGVNGVEVYDIFAFLNAWFAGDLRADIDQSGVLKVLDIFTFIGEWRAGC